MPYYVRPMRMEDVAQVTEIDREAFPTQLPPPNYEHELQNQLAHYIVACDSERTIDEAKVKASSEKNSTGLASSLRRLFRRYLFSSNELPQPGGHCITGFAGLWIMADEAHIINIAVREAYRQLGIGELLLINSIDLAAKLKARIITLEVRVSNTAARSLYVKYGFTQVGVRRGYYIDNREDGLVMSTQDITQVAFQAYLQQVKQEYSKRWGISLKHSIR